ncbi:hypothetical protein [Amphritea pacifica]|uniref:hypothetical protein n=1 Tax=Amphritea pacifica TaxID=2811233 RepID=UPI0019666767|nr:hypothetical protein [Amphritea pacifica]MBN1005731.1 hypothetical protein [Amphritea pacifica]
MLQYMITYIGGDKPATVEEGQQHYALYKDWLRSLGSVVLNPATPFRITHTVNPDGSVSIGSASSMSGYSVIEVDSMETAVKAVKRCPFLGINGSLEVSELVT